LAASLLALYRISGVPSFLAGPAAVVADLPVVAVPAGLAFVAAVAVFDFFAPVAGVVCAKLNPVKASNKLTISTIFFMFRVFSDEKIKNYKVNLSKYRELTKKKVCYCCIDRHLYIKKITDIWVTLTST